MLLAAMVLPQNFVCGKGSEKGHFEFGGSCLILLFPGWLRNRTGTRNRNRQNRFFPKPKAEPEPFPRSNKRCFLNGVFQSGALRGLWGSAKTEGTKMHKNTGVLRQFLSFWKGVFSVASWGEESAKKPFGTLRRFPGAETGNGTVFSC